MNQEGNQSAKGFTLVELMLSMAFISVLMVAIAMTVIQIMNVYNKGVTLRSVDQAGRGISQDIKYTLSSSQILDVNSAGMTGNDFVLQARLGDDANTRPDGGRLCTGTYTYIWNTGKGMDYQINRFAAGNDVIHLIKIRDNSKEYCDIIRTPQIQQEGVSELLSADAANLAVQNFMISSVASDAAMQQALYQITIELGTGDESAIDRPILSTMDATCKPPSDAMSQRDYCAINKFEFTARAGNRGGQ